MIQYKVVTLQTDSIGYQVSDKVGKQMKEKAWNDKVEYVRSLDVQKTLVWFLRYNIINLTRKEELKIRVGYVDDQVRIKKIQASYQQLQQKLFHQNIICIFCRIPLQIKIAWPSASFAEQILANFLVVFHVYTQPWTNWLEG